MKKKFISLGVLIVLLAVMLVGIFAVAGFALPVSAADVDVGMTSSAGHAVMDSPAAPVIIDETAPAPTLALVASTALVSAPAPTSTINEWSVWVALSAILLTTAVVLKRRLYKLLNLTVNCLRRLNRGTDEGTDKGVSIREGIAPAAV